MVSATDDRSVIPPRFIVRALTPPPPHVMVFGDGPSGT